MKLKLHGLEDQVKSLSERNDELTRTRNEYETTLLTHMQDNDRLTAAVGDLSSKSVLLESRLKRADKEIQELRERTSNYSSLDEAVLQYISDTADKLHKFETEAGEDIEILDRDLGILSKDGEIIQRCLRENRDETETNLRTIFDEKNSDDERRYQELKLKVEAAKKQIQEGHIPEIILEAAKTALVPFEKEITAYEDLRETFVRDYSDKFEKFSSLHKKTQRIRELAKEKGFVNIPVYLRLEELKDSYVLTAFVPIKNNPSGLCERVLAENVFSVETLEQMNKSDVDNIKRENDPKTGLIFYQVNLPKDRYNADKVLELKSSVEENVRKGFIRSGLENIGLGVEIAFNQPVTESFGGQITSDSKEDYSQELYDEIIRHGTREGNSVNIRASKVKKILRNSFPNISDYGMYSAKNKLQESGILTLSGHASGTVYTIITPNPENEK
jgi:hypothetical protein